MTLSGIAKYRWARRLPAGLKLAALAATSVALMWVEAPALLLAALGLVVALTAAAGALSVLRGLKPLAWMLGFVVLAHGLLGDWPLGLAVALRIAALVVLAAVISASTPLSEMLRVFETLLWPLRLVMGSTRPISVTLAMTLRFIPLLAERWQTLTESWRARSPRRPGWRLVVPFLIGALDDADHAAEALAARRGFQTGAARRGYRKR